ncbi:serine-rich adhesin for platelets-like [Mugil cephalus]|uniref:serine-rich adhesin for platelets-like n=1 Tax=Mugil cephalus TaxID=48193 RepID=UPI001FB73D07|nr:serine-rich adhesin for platelets-like [Mugil cephalus]
MELPLGGPALRHYTQSRPRPHRQKLNYRPSRPQETIIESENEVLELMGRVDEGVEEFFTKRVLPTETLKQQDDEAITVHEVAPASSVPCPPPTKTLRRKLGDFFTLKKRRGLKSETSHEGRTKKASIADLIRPLREVARSEKEKEKDRERVKEQDKENEKDKVKEHPSAVSGEAAVQETPVSGGAPPLRGEAVPPRRALREGKSQSLILLSGSAAAGTTNARNTAKKQLEGQHSFEQKLHLMLQRIGVSKQQPGETQNQEGEMKKAESEGTIIDSKPEPPPTFSKPRTMSASSDTRHQIRASVSAHEAAGKPALLPKPVIKPGPPLTTSGRNTPENELAQIQEAETNTPTKPGPAPAPAPSTPTAPALTATTAPTEPTISDSTNFTVSPSSTVTPSDTDICTDSVNPTTAATTPTSGTVLDSKASIPDTSASTTEIPTSTFQTTLTSTTAPTEAPTSVSDTPTSSESITPSLSVTSSSATITSPSITTSETVSAPSIEGSVSKTTTDLSAKSTLPEQNSSLSVDAAPAAGSDAAISVTTAAFSPSTSTTDVPPGISATIGSVSTGDSTSSSSVTLVSSVTDTTCPPRNSHDIITTAASHDAPITTSSTMISTALPPPTTAAETIDPASSADSVSTPAIIHPASANADDMSVPSTSSSKTNPTGTFSTATSLNRADTTSTTSSAAAISSPHATDPDPPPSSNVSITVTPPVSDLPATDNSGAASHHVTSSAPSKDTPGSGNDLHTSSEQQSGKEPAKKDTGDEEMEMVQKSKITEMDEKEGADDSKKSNSEKPTLVNKQLTGKEGQEVTAEVVTLAEPASGKEGERSTTEREVERQKQEETKAVSDK